MKPLSFVVLITVLALSCATFVQAGLEDGLVLYLPFDEGSGDVTGDLSGNGHDGDIEGPIWTEGKFGKALEFNGDGDFVDVPYSDDFAITDAITLGAWVTANVPFPINWKGIINARKSTYGPFLLQTGANPASPLGEMGLYLGGAWTWVQTVKPLDEEFHHVVGTFDADDGYHIYFDGEMNDGAGGADKGIIDTDPAEEGVVIGHNYGYADRWWDGIIDEVVIYNRALSEDEVAQLFEAPPIAAAVYYKDKLSTTWGKLKNSR